MDQFIVPCVTNLSKTVNARMRMMSQIDNAKLIIRQVKSKSIPIQFIYLRRDFSYFSVKDKTYFGRITPDQSLNEYCTCCDFMYRNDDYKAKYQINLNCKHMIAAKRIRGWWD